MRFIKRVAFLAAGFLALAGAGSAPAGQAKKQIPTFSVGVETVFVKVAVTDPLNRYVTGLEKEHFRIYEDKVEQTIVHFTQETAPVSVGILFDVSASMKENNNIGNAKNAILRFLETGNPDDEYFLIEFNQTTTLVQNFTSAGSTIQSSVAFGQPRGRTAIYDAVYMGLEKCKEGRNEKKALILVTDGEDNSSRYSAAEVREFARETDVQIYAIGQEGKLGYGRSEIQNIVAMTGGRAFFPNNFSELDYYIDLIHAELRNQYVLGYIPTNKAHDGKWRRIRVRLEPPEGLPKLIVRAKEGYYAPKN